MTEFILIAGDRVQVPPDVVTKGRDAVADWHKAQPGYVPPPPPELVAEPVGETPDAAAKRLAKLDAWNKDQHAKATKTRAAATADTSARSAEKE